MKKSLIAAFLAGAMVFSSGVMAFADEGILLKDILVDDEVIYEGERVTIAGEASDSYAIKFYDQEFSVNKEDVLKIKEDKVQYNVTVNALNLREGAGTNFPIVKSLSRGMILVELDKKDDWTKIEYKDVVGWVHNDFIEKIEFIIVGKIKEDVSVDAKDITYKLVKNDTVQVIGYRAGHYQIQINDDKLFLRKELLEIINDGEPSAGIVYLANYPTASRGGSRHNIIEVAKKELGKPYKYATAGPNSFDCSGFAYYVFAQFNIKLPRSSSEQSKVGTAVERSDLRMGDLVFFDTSRGRNGQVSHVGIYIGEGSFIHAESGANGKIEIATMNSGYYNTRYLRARRVLE